MAHEPSTARLALGGFFALILAMGIGRFAFTPLLPMMQQEGLLNIASGGVLASIHYLGYAMGAVIAARLTGNALMTLTMSLVVIGVATITMGLSDSYIVWLVARWVAGVCSALALVVVSSHFLGQLAQRGHSNLQGVVFAGVGCGITIAGLFTLAIMATGLTSTTGWLAFGFTCFGALAYLAMGDIRRGGQIKPIRGSAGTHDLATAWRIILPYGALGAGYVIPATYLPIMAQQTVPSPLIYGWGWPLFGLAAMISVLLLAAFPKAFPNRKTWFASQFAMAVGLILPALWPHLASVLVGGVLVGATLTLVTLIAMKESHRVAADGAVQPLVAAMTFAFAMGQVAGPFIAGWMYEWTGSFTAPLLLGAVLLIVTMIPMALERSEGVS